MDRSSSRRALLVVVVVLLAILAALDLTSRNSFLRRAWGGDDPTRQEEMIQEMQRRGVPVPAPRGSLLFDDRRTPLLPQTRVGVMA